LYFSLITSLEAFTRSKVLTDFFLKLLGLLVRVGLLLAGLVVFASLLTVAFLLLMIWLLRALWAKLTGQPVNPFAFKVNRQAVWQRFYRGSSKQQSSVFSDAEVLDADVCDVTVVTDVEPKRIEPMKPKAD
jgi:hypothetical protein